MEFLTEDLRTLGSLPRIPAPSPTLKELELLMEDFVQATGVWKLITVQPCLFNFSTFASLWRDIKVVNDHAFIVSEASGHGMQVSI